jgi:hypothetical protein
MSLTRETKSHHLRLFTLLLIPLAVIPIFSGWVGDIAKDWLGGDELSSADFWLFGFGLGGVLLLALVILMTGRKLLGVENIEESADVVPRRVVIALLSPCKNLSPPRPGEDASAWRVKDLRNADKLGPLMGLNLDQVIDPVFRLEDGNPLPQWSWQQTIRAAHHHGEKLERVVLIGSEGQSGSGTTEQLDLAKRFFSYYFPGKVYILGEPQRDGTGYDSHWQADFEKLDDLRRLLKRALADLHKDDYADADIIIDCTGGQKTASIACALVTLDRPDLIFQYVGTGPGPRTGKIIGFNVVTETRAD